VAKNKKKQRAKKKLAGARRKFSSPSQTRAQLEGITAAQERYRRAKKRNTGDKNEATYSDAAGIIIDSREKSEQAWKNALRAVRRPEDLNGFE
jgi:hypothetical protein